MHSPAPVFDRSVSALEESQRLAALQSYDILDTPPEVIFDELARMAASVCNTPIALVSFVDDTRQWFKARVGLDTAQTARELAFCAHAISGREPFVVPNALNDPRFAGNPLVTADPHIRFYLGAPLITPGGEALGTLCVIDRVPRELSADRIEILKLLSRQVMTQLELRKRVNELSSTNARRASQIDALQETQEKLDTLLQQQQAQLTQLSQHNPQTGLANRASFLTRIGHRLQAAAGSAAVPVVFVLDMQRFAWISETLGQSQLDELLRHVAQRLVEALGARQDVAHLEADRFAVLIPSAKTSAEAAAFLEDRLLPALCAPYTVGEEELRVAFKVGIALAPVEGIAPESFLRRAKTALMKAKESDEIHAVFSIELEGRVSSVITLETKLRRALERQQFELFYQPKTSLRDGSITGVEALIRWRDPAPEGRAASPQTTWIPPALFVPALESTGLILEVGRWAIAQAVHDQRDWQANGFTAPRVAVNISPLQLRHRNFLGDFRAILDTPGLAPEVDIELTEAVLIEQADRCIESLHTLREWGVRVAIDDFGSGYSSLRYLARLPIDALKIDMSFVHAMSKGPDNLAIVSSVISLAHSLRLKTVAEGVETEEQRHLLSLLRCDEMQGYLFSKPVSKTQVEAFLAPTEGRPP